MMLHATVMASDWLPLLTMAFQPSESIYMAPANGATGMVCYLDGHAVIAWDMDGTLVGGPYSKFFRSYIASTPHKTHHIVTFRNRAWASTIPDELADLGLAPECIATISSCPEDLFEAYADQFGHVDQTKVRAYLTFKGMAAKALGATALVDDMEALVMQGCAAHNVAFIHAHDPIFAFADMTTHHVELNPPEGNGGLAG